MALLKEFEAFALKGNVVELAVAVVIGAAFSAIVNSLVEHITTPSIPLPLLEGAGLKNPEDPAWGAVKYGKALLAVIGFVLVAFALFLVIRLVNGLKEAKEKPVAPAALWYPLQEKLLMEIRDSLRK